MSKVATIPALYGLMHDFDREEMLTLTDSDNRPEILDFLHELEKKKWHRVSYDPREGLMPLVERARVGLGSQVDSPSFPLKHFPLKEGRFRTVKVSVKAYLEGETMEQAVRRLMRAERSFGNAGDLAVYLHLHPEEVRKWTTVEATNANLHRLWTAVAWIDGASRHLDWTCHNLPRSSRDGILVTDE